MGGREGGAALRALGIGLSPASRLCDLHLSEERRVQKSHSGVEIQGRGCAAGWHDVPGAGVPVKAQWTLLAMGRGPRMDRSQGDGLRGMDVTGQQGGGAWTPGLWGLLEVSNWRLSQPCLEEEAGGCRITERSEAPLAGCLRETGTRQAAPSWGQARRPPLGLQGTLALESPGDTAPHAAGREHVGPSAPAAASCPSAPSAPASLELPAHLFTSVHSPCCRGCRKHPPHPHPGRLLPPRTLPIASVGIPGKEGVGEGATSLIRTTASGTQTVDKETRGQL